MSKKENYQPSECQTRMYKKWMSWEREGHAKWMSGKEWPAKWTSDKNVKSSECLGRWMFLKENDKRMRMSDKNVK